jgi:hypothetical protein
MGRGGGIDPVRGAVLLASPFLRSCSYSFSSESTTPQTLLLRSIEAPGEDGRAVQIARIDPAQESNVGNPVMQFSNILGVAQNDPSLPLSGPRVSVEGGILHQERIATNLASYTIPNQAYPGTWPISWLVAYLGASFFFSPFRHSKDQLAVQESPRLDQDGANLVQVLHTLSNTNDQIFDRIRGFLDAALPGLGRLQTPLTGAQTFSAFRSPERDFAVRILNMGGGIEQLLMVATVLATTDKSSPLFLEEPETHLHPGAQRFLIERLLEDGRQTALTTHSPTFLNLAYPKEVFRLSLNVDTTVITKVVATESLSEVLADVGARNSDVLMSDAVAFVEGESDADALITISSTVGVSWPERNIAVVPIGGADHINAAAPVTSATLERISECSAVPHLFILDRDERSDTEIERLATRMPGRISYLRRRELENYLVDYGAVKATLAQKYPDGSHQAESTKALTRETFNEVLASAAEGLYPQVLIGRLRRSLGTLIGGWIDRDGVNVLAAEVGRSDFANYLAEWIEERVARAVNALEIEVTFAKVKQALDKDWTDERRRLEMAPGSELLDAIFRTVGGTYSKPGDTALLARNVPIDALDDELVELCYRVADL